MSSCISRWLCRPGWTGLPIGYFEPRGHSSLSAVESMQDSLILWNDGASPVTVSCQGEYRHYARHRGVLDLMAAGDAIRLRHERPETPGSGLIVVLPTSVREAYHHAAGRPGVMPLTSRFNLQDEVMAGMVRLLEWQCRSDEGGGKILTESVSSALLAYLEQTGAAAVSIAPAKPAMKIGPQQRRALLHYVEEHLSLNIGLSEMAELLGMSISQLGRVFRLEFGTSPYRYVMTRRVERARTLLAAGELTLAEIALQCGFSSQSHFTSVFSTYTGMTPGLFRHVA